MNAQHNDDAWVVGLGITSSIGQGKQTFINELLAGASYFDYLKRPGRQIPKNSERDDSDLPFLGAEINKLQAPDSLKSSVLRNTSFSTQVALATLYEAWHDAKLDQVDPAKIGLIVGGSNFQQRHLTEQHNKYQGKEPFLRPTYGLSFMDTDLCGTCTEMLGIEGLAMTVGGASASGQLAVIQAAQAVQSRQVDYCIALGAMMDLSYWECRGFRALGAMGSDRFHDKPQHACRPFDDAHDGFIFGEACAAVVITRKPVAYEHHLTPYARMAGWSIAMDANRHPNPSLEGESKAIQGALLHAGYTAQDIDYVNPHGTGSLIGDETELRALERCQLKHAYLNTTKSIVGHSLTAAGAVEIAAILLQMQAKTLHPCLNLDSPIDHSFQWVKSSQSHTIKRALKMSMGFGGINTALCLENLNV